MPYIFSWTPSRVLPKTSSDIYVYDVAGNPAALSAPTTFSAGVATISVSNAGTYVAVISDGSYQEAVKFDAASGVSWGFFGTNAYSLNQAHPQGGSLTIPYTSSTTINASGHLILSKADGSTSDSGAIVIPDSFRVVWTGDSISIGDNPNVSQVMDRTLYGNNPATYAMLASDGRWRLMGNAGYRGHTSAQILASLATDTASGNVVVINSCYWNDITHGVAVSQTMSNISSMVGQLRSAGKVVVLGLPTPAASGDSASNINAINQLHASASYLAYQLGVPTIDYMAVLVDSATGCLKAAYNRDGSIHPNDAGYQAMGQAAQKVLDSVIPASASALVSHSKHPYDIVGGNGFYLANTGGVGSGTVWNNVASPAAASIATDSAVPGNMQRISANSAPAAQNLDLSTTGWSVGDVLEVSGVLTFSGPGPVSVILLTNLYSSASSGGTNPNVGTELTISQPVTRGHFSFRLIPPAGSTTVNVRQLVAANAGATTLDIGQVSVRNLTKLGVG